MKKTLLVTGSNGLIGSEMVSHFHRAGLGGPRRRQQHAGRLLRPPGRHALEPAAAARRATRASSTTSSTSATAPGSRRWCETCAPDADRPHRRPAQPRPGRQAARSTTSTSTPCGTLNLLEATRRQLPRRRRSSTCPRTRCTATRRTASRSTSCDTRWDYADPAFADGIPETFTHRPVQALAVRRLQGGRRRHGAGVRPLLRHADLLPPRRLPDRANHSGVELHGFLSYLVKCNLEGRHLPRLRLQGQAGPRQHPLATTWPASSDAFIAAPRSGEVYNLGGGRGQLLLDPRGVRPRRGS